MSESDSVKKCVCLSCSQPDVMAKIDEEYRKKPIKTQHTLADGTNIDTTIVAQQPKLRSYTESMITNISEHGVNYIRDF